MAVTIHTQPENKVTWMFMQVTHKEDKTCFIRHDSIYCATRGIYSVMKRYPQLH